MKTVKKTVKYKKKISILDIIQLILGIVLLVYYFFALIPFVIYITMDNIFFLLLIQIIISLIRLRIFNFIFEIIIAGLTAIGLIPILGIPFLILGFIFLLIDTLTFKSYRMKKYVNIHTYTSNNKPKTSKSKRISNSKVYEADYKER